MAISNRQLNIRILSMLCIGFARQAIFPLDWQRNPRLWFAPHLCSLVGNIARLVKSQLCLKLNSLVHCGLKETRVFEDQDSRASQRKTLLSQPWIYFRRRVLTILWPSWTSLLIRAAQRARKEGDLRAGCLQPA